jgi:hypothetical protein
MSHGSCFSQESYGVDVRSVIIPCTPTRAIPAYSCGNIKIGLATAQLRVLKRKNFDMFRQRKVRKLYLDSMSSSRKTVRK